MQTNNIKKVVDEMINSLTEEKREDILIEAERDLKEAVARVSNLRHRLKQEQFSRMKGENV